MDFNKEYTGEKYRNIALKMGVEGAEKLTLEEVRVAAVHAVKSLGIDVGIPQNLVDLGVRKEDVAQIAKDAFSDVCTPGNPREVSVEEIKALYLSML